MWDKRPIEDGLRARNAELLAILRRVAEQPRMPARVLSGALRETMTLFEDDIARIDAVLEKNTDAT